MEEVEPRRERRPRTPRAAGIAPSLEGTSLVKARVPATAPDVARPPDVAVGRRADGRCTGRCESRSTRERVRTAGIRDVQDALVPRRSGMAESGCVPTRPLRTRKLTGRTSAASWASVSCSRAVQGRANAAEGRMPRAADIGPSLDSTSLVKARVPRRPGFVRPCTLKKNRRPNNGPPGREGDRLWRCGRRSTKKTQDNALWRALLQNGGHPSLIYIKSQDITGPRMAYTPKLVGRNHVRWEVLQPGGGVCLQDHGD